MEILQDILIIILAGYMTMDEDGIVLLTYFPVIVGLATGLIMGDLHTAMVVAGTFQLMMLGVAALGGASVPNYGLATIVGAFVAIRTGTGLKTAIAVGIPVGLLAIQLEVLRRIIANFVAHKMQTLNEEKKWKQMLRWGYAGPVLCFVETALPTAIVVLVGPTAIKMILKFIPTWITDGLTVAGGLLPLVGIAMLLHYMPVKKFLPFLVAGFVLAAFIKIPIIGIALLGLAAAYWYFNSEIDKNKYSQNQAVAKNDTTGEDYDE